jgi:Ca2+-binding EF-hand superfamily protein
MQVDQAEFIMFMLQELNLVNAHELENILEMFAAIDANGDGKLNLADVRRRMTLDRTRSMNAQSLTGAGSLRANQARDHSNGV